ncbi:hypothetical protein [Kitasatospora sp. CB02891]|uniref:hypothetical protein n=1 Tax=Kitasatospora sp. CB02891 TaxID=2020329 RepID=UPI000C279E3C|nr:hypothetical protein [Kitasatospora sp. CB02891]PJN24050.1 hypothetical protein CG736_19330 [Kitasatospora sp. CB02891]
MSDEGTEQAIGHVLDALNVTATLNEGELVAGAVVLLKVLQEDGETRLSLTYSDGLGWIERIGMLRVAELVDNGSSTLGSHAE